MKEEALLKRIVVNPKIMVGKPVIKGTRIPVELILRLLAKGTKKGEILSDYPQLKKEDLTAALFYATKTASREEYYPILVR